MDPVADDDIEKAIAVALAVVPRTFRNGFGGKGVRRRREPTATKEVSVVVTRYLSHTYTFYEDDRKVEKDNVETFLAVELTAIPDDLAKTFADKLTLNSEPARNEIAARLAGALVAKWRWAYKPSDAIHLKPMFGD
ncbi:hypothetical protein ACQZ46_11405 [Agrobacterium salinitolerans]|uniref:hypothetical protein n=1 Tax=Agrobacterium salinitolerans TaxID=1183413 RepID=UPI0022B83699|nr:hypothetical protein [Agrobacterium salinitolerans]MCZ7858545.1 hypothetical protein [Agrobacterium salinitolerans]